MVMKDNNEFLLLVIYIGVSGIRSEDIDTYTKEILNKLSPKINGQIISIPVQSYDSKIECINPKYITENDLINENTKLIRKLNEELKNQLNILKNNDDEEN